jgi:DNA-binding PadR family transcriptional regulator
VSFSLDERISTHGSRFEYTQHTISFRLEEIVSMLDSLQGRGLLTHRRVHGFSDSAGITANMYQLTDDGEAYCEEVVKGGVTQLFL